MNRVTPGAMAIIAVGSLAVLAGCDGSEDAVGETAPSTRPVKIAVAQQPAESVTRVFPAIVTANDSVRLSFKVAGRLVEYPVNNGTSLKAGDLIGRLDPLDYQNRVDAAQALVTAARAKLDRMQLAQEKNAVSEIEVIEQRAALDSAIARVNIAKKALRDTELRAPYDGVVATRLSNAFSEVAAGQAVVLFESDDIIELELSIPEQDIVHASALHPGTLRAGFDALPARSFPLTLKEVETRGDSVTQTYRVGVTMPPPADVNILPGIWCPSCLTALTYRQLP